jgi:pimeloyl-ACP methyl ester carboxylesterase
VVTHLIYIPGLNDRLDIGRAFALKLWRLFGVATTFVPMNWSDEELYTEKYQRATSAIKAAQQQNHRIVLVGESAGGSLALTLYAKHPTAIHKTITICGKNTRPNTVSPHTYRRNPAFKESMELAVTAEKQLNPQQRPLFISVYPLFDETVPVHDTLIPGCTPKQVWLIGHTTTIIAILAFGGWYIARLARLN